MNQYTIYCTSEQTKKALELGAPLFRLYGTGCSDYIDMLIISDTEAYTIPTAEQMIGWLEEQGIKFKIYKKFKNSWHYYVGSRTRREPIKEFDNLKTRQEATIAAIDAALEYLITNKN